MLTVEEVAKILKVQPLTVRQMFREGRIRGFKIGKAWRTTMPILEEDIACMSRGEAPHRLEQATPAAGAPAGTGEAAPARKRRAKPAQETAEAAVSEPVTLPTPPAPVAAEAPAAPEIPAAEESGLGGKRKRKSAPEDNTDQQLLF